MGLGEVLVFSYMNLLINGFLVTTPSIVKYSFKKFLQMKVVVFCLGLYTTTLKALSCQRSIESGARISKVPIINGPGKLSPFTLKIEVSIVLHLA